MEATLQSKIALMTESTNKISTIFESINKISQTVDSIRRVSNIHSNIKNLSIVNSNLTSLEYLQPSLKQNIFYANTLGMGRYKDVLEQIGKVDYQYTNKIFSRPINFDNTSWNTPKQLDLNNWEWSLREKSDLIEASHKIIISHIKSISEYEKSLSPKSNSVLETNTFEYVENVDEKFLLPSEILKRIKDLSTSVQNFNFMHEPISLDSLLSEMYIASDNFVKEKKSTDRLIAFVVASKLKLNKVRELCRLNRRDVFRRINSFFFKNLDDSHDLTLVSFGY